MTDLRPIVPLEIVPAHRITRAPVSPPPSISWIPIDHLVVDADYQRDIGKRGRINILKMVAGWDWNCYKPLSVAPVEGQEGMYEVVDGQHTAIAAATHGSITLLPCVVMSATSAKAKAKAFLGINRERVTLTPYALYRAKLVAGDENSEAVDRCLAMTGATLVESLQTIPDDDFRIGMIAAVSTLTTLVKAHGEVRLRRLLTIAIKAEAVVINGGLLNGLAWIMYGPEANIAPSDSRLIEAIKAYGAEDIADEAIKLSRGDKKGRAALEGWVEVIMKAVARLDDTAQV